LFQITPRKLKLRIQSVATEDKELQQLITQKAKKWVSDKKEEYSKRIAQLEKLRDELDEEKTKQTILDELKVQFY
jgi:hypothetical protein